MKHEIARRELTPNEASEAREIFKTNKAVLSEYIDRLMWWNKKVNLVSRDVPRETITRHVEHSLIVSTSALFKEVSFIVDSGTGGGLPGIPLAVAHPSKEISLNDIVSKKIMACKHIATGIGLKNISSSSVSIEEVEVPEGGVIISKHAFKVNDLLGMLKGKPWFGIILLKGGEEIEEELVGVEESLLINIIDLEKGFNNSFYEGKSMVEISRKGG